MPLQGPEKELLEKSARTYLEAFACAVDPNYTLNFHHKIIARKLEKALDDAMHNRKARIIIELPPRHGKTEMSGIKFPAWALGKYPKIPIINCSYGADLAVTSGLRTRDLMVDPNYQGIFRTRLRPDQTAKGRWLTEEGGSYTSAGVGGGITGRGFKVGIIDDPFKNFEEASSSTIREKVIDWYKSTFYTRQEGYGAIIVIMTRWHKQDLIGYLLNKEEEDRAAGVEEFDEWDVIRFPAIAEEEEEYRHIGEPLWPAKVTLAMLENTRNTLGLYQWNALYQQHPIASEHQEFKKEWFKYYEPQLLLTIPGLKYYTLVDLGHKDRKDKGAKREPDKTVVRTIAKARLMPQWYLIDETAGIFDPGQTLDAIFLHQKLHGSEVWLEGVGYQRALQYFAREKMERTQQVFNFNLLKRNGTVAKSERVRGLIPLYSNGFVYHRANGADQALEREALDFPQGEYDDRIDCLANGLEAIANTLAPQKKKEKGQHTPMSEYGG